MKTNYKSRNIFFFLFIILISFSCSKDNPTEPNQNWGDNFVKADITYDDNVVKFDENDANDFVSVDSLNFKFSINENNSKVKNLKIGDIFVYRNFAICKVSNITKIGKTYIINSEPIPLTEAISDANIEWDYGIEFSEESVIKNLRDHKANIIQVGNKYQFEFTYGSFKVTGEITFQEKETPITLTIEKSIADVPVAKLIVDGKFSRFRSKGKCKIKNHELTEFSTNANELNGEFEISVITTASGYDKGIEIPFPLVSGPIGVPFFTWSIKFLGVIYSYVPPGSSALIKEKFTYSASQGFSYASSTNQVNTSANKTKSQIEKASENQHTGGPSQVQVSWGIAIPRFEISLMGTTLAWFQTAFLLDGYYNFYPACQMINAHFYGAAGWGLGLLGVTIASGSKNLWDDKKVIIKSGDCPE